MEWPCDAMPDLFKTFAENSTGSGGGRERSKLFFILTQFLVLAHWSRVELPSDLRTRRRRSKGGKKFCNQEARWEYYCVLGELIGIVWQLFCNSCLLASIPWWKGGPFYPRHRVKIKGLVIWELVGKKMRFWGMLEAFHSRGSSDSNHLLPITLFASFLDDSVMKTLFDWHNTSTFDQFPFTNVLIDSVKSTSNSSFSRVRVRRLVWREWRKPTHGGYWEELRSSSLVISLISKSHALGITLSWDLHSSGSPEQMLKMADFSNTSF